MIPQLFIGSGNKAKIETYKRFLADTPVKIITLKDITVAEPEETGSSLEENAKLKANYYFEKTGIPTLADDGGFEIPALGNFPGSHSRRFTGAEMSDEEIITAILDRMKRLKGNDRRARFRVVLALKLPATQVHIASGEIAGHVPEQPLNRHIPHFPYRSLLFVDKLNKWFYDITEAEEEHLGYRKAAFTQLKHYL